MKKRLIALLLSVCIVLGMVPGGIIFSAKGEATGTLTVDGEGQGVCPVCDTTVTWKAFKGNSSGTEKIDQINDKGHHHYYLSADVDARKISAYFINLLSSKLCLHLNGYDLTYGGYIYASGSTLNIMGSGNVTFTATKINDGYDQGGLYINNSTLNLYGGTYGVADVAEAADKPTLYLKSGSVKVKNAVLHGRTLVENGTLSVEDTAQLENIQVKTGGKLDVKRSWTGSAQVDFDAAMKNNVVPAANGVCEGPFAGTLKMQHGVVLQGTDAGTLTGIGFNASLVLDADSNALCPVCDEVVKWTAFGGNSAGTLKIGQINDKAHHHYYLSADVNARNINAYFINLISSTMCLHLNGFDLVHGGYIFGSGATFNIMGSGNVTFTATKTNAGYDASGLHMDNSTLNLYGGTYGVAEVAETEGKPTIYLKNGAVNVKTAKVQGKTHIQRGTLTLEDVAELDDIQVEATGKLAVKSTWSGMGRVDFAAELVDNKVPAANATAESGYTGLLRLPDDSKLRPDENGILVATGLNTGLMLDADLKAECPLCEQTVSWTQVKDGGNIGWKKDQGHLHYYLAGDVTTGAGGQFMELEAGTKVCLHLNGHNLTLSGQCRLWADTVLNVMGTGNVDFVGTVSREDWTEAGILVRRGTANLYGGTYTVSGPAAEAGKPAVLARQATTSQVVLAGATIAGPTQIELGNLTLQKKSNTSYIRIGTQGKLTVSENWTGTAQVDFDARLEDYIVPEANAQAEGVFAGTLTMSDGSRLFATEKGLLMREITISPDSNSEAYCPVCDKTVKWTAFSGNSEGTANIGQINDQAHHHYYLSADADARNISGFFINLLNSNLCLHLNGHDLYYGGYIFVSGANLNIMGSGNMIFTATKTGAGYDQGGMYIGSGTLNLYGGAFGVAEVAETADKPTLYMRGGQVNVKDAVLRGRTYVEKGVLTIEDTANLENIQVDTIGKLKVADNWLGAAEVAFASGVSNGVVPQANGESTGDFIGGLRLQDGTRLVANEGKLVMEKIPSLRLTEDEFGYCDVCRKLVKWSPIKNGKYLGGIPQAKDMHHHYYFADDNMTTAIGQFLMVIYPGNEVCLHLNNKNVTVSGAMLVNGGAKLNILGDGHIDFLGNATNEIGNIALFHAANNNGEKAIDIYGGTYTSSTGKPIYHGNGGNFTVNMILKLSGNANLDGLVMLNQSQIHLKDSASVKLIEGSNTASIRVDENWRGSVTVDYLTDIVDTYVSEYNGRSSGKFIGGLMLADGRRLIGENGKLRVAESSLVLNEQNEGYCEVCHKVVTWKGIEGKKQIGSFSDGGHHHYYLSGDLQMPDGAAQMLNLDDSKFCLHLNGKNLIHGGIYAGGSDTVLNILGKGNVIYTGISNPGLQAADDAKLNLLGGTYSVEGDAQAQETPVISAEGNVSLNNTQVLGRVDIQGKTLKLDGTTKIDKIYVGNDGKLNLADSWNGTASAAFENPFVGNAIPADQLSGKDYTGELTLVDGRSVVAGVIDGEKVDPNLRYRTTQTGVELVRYTGEGDYLLPVSVAGMPVTAIADGAFDSFTGKLYIGKNNTVGLTYANEKGLNFTEASAYTQADGTVQLQSNVENLTFEKDTVLDLNGYRVNGVTVTNGTLFVMDSQTDDYTVKDGIYGKITGITGNVQAAEGYLQVTENGAVSFHRVNLDIYAMSLRMENAGVYFNSYFAGDEVVASKVESFGVALSVKEAPDASNLKNKCGYSVFTGFKAGKDANVNATSTLLKGIFKDIYSEAENTKRGAIPVYGRAYIKTADGYVFGETVKRSLQEQVELADAGFAQLSKTQKADFRNMFKTYETVVKDWDISEVRNYEDMLWFAEPAPQTGAGFEQYSVPIGNGYMGVTIFGGTESELLSISDKEMFNPKDGAPAGGNGWGSKPPAGPDGEELMAMSTGGYANMCKAYIDFGHDYDQVSNYQRDLILNTAEAHVRYDYDGVTYNRTYFANYPDNVTVMKLDASQSGKLTFTLRPVATSVRDYCTAESDGLAKTGTVTASGDTAIVAGTLKGYNINYEAQFKVIPVGGTMVANADGTITVENADSAVILLSVDTNYELKPETLTAPDAEKLDPNSYPHDKVTAVINAASQKTYEQLRETHLKDYQDLYCSVEMDLGGTPSTDIPTDKKMQAYREGDFDPYIEELLFQYGRYLLIASSRNGALPANLQGVWQYYCSAAWSGGYVYNINLQMNYWSCFATNLAELFEPNIEFFDAIWPTLEANADKYLKAVKSPYIAESGTGANGIAIGSSGTPYRTPTVNASASTHTGPGSTGYTSDLFWQYYQFTMDDTKLKEKIYPYLEGAATFLSKTLEEYDGKWLVSHSASPENNMYFEDPFVTVGTMFDQMMTRESFVQVLEAARLLKYTAADSPILATIESQLDKLDPVNVGKNGHVKEYREEEYYGDYGLYEHHGMGQLVGVYPGTTITSKTDAWQDAAAVTAIERGINFTGHQASFKQLVWARLGDAANSYLIAQEHIVKYIRDNLLNTHAPFQIDGNFGYTAGVAEMLLQSHEGYIKVLPALPAQWNTGSYKGLTARGGFEVDVVWEDGNATEIAITSNAGQPCSLNHFRVSTATVTDSKGNPVVFTVDNKDQITFATVQGETYTITDLQAKPNVEPAKNLSVTGNFNLAWEASPDAVSYKVYRAVNDQATYELIAENVTGTTYAYNPTDLKSGDQLILRVTAVNADGVESEGTRVITWIED